MSLANVKEIMSNDYRICSRCIMDTSAGDITFDAHGFCNYCSMLMELLDSRKGQEKPLRAAWATVVAEMKARGRGDEYDCVLGVSGSLDSSYALYVARKAGLRVLAVHLDNGWNSELAVSNIERLCKSLDVDLYTHVINWEEVRALQIALFKGNVIDIEMITDHAITAVLYRIAAERRLKYIVAGTNIANEGMRMPPGWNSFVKAMSSRTLLAIYRKTGDGRKLETFPLMSLPRYLLYRFIHHIRWFPVLDYVPYDKHDSIRILSAEVGWRPYEKKHYESVFTRFYQGYILPVKFGVDKRKVHYSTLICSGQMTREDALASMSEEPYQNTALLREDREYVLKKLGFDEVWFSRYLKEPEVPQTRYSNEAWFFRTLFDAQRRICGQLRCRPCDKPD